ncbi:carbamoyltransferase HypF [Candidatus Bathyarchaeota archaeon]|nr:carbamoyltransferase HypF [Candidatus Bathyarchaeota archaeon]
MRVDIKVSGIVQGVGFRPFIYRIAVKHNLAGYVRNRGDAVVEIVVEGKRDNINQFIKNIQNKKPVLAQIYNIVTSRKKEEDSFSGFKIRQSSEITKTSGSVIPPDVSICNECLNELRNPENRRFNYFFITCTNCGPRYTIINRLPYDRPNTTMKEFQMCEKCATEYDDPLNRRFHAQTVACSICGPKVFLASSEGEQLESKDPIRETGKLLEEGKIVAIRGNGGFHIATATTIAQPIIRLRKDKHRKQKPFAIMAPDMKTIRSFADVNLWESEALTSYRKPIVVLKKNENYNLSEFVSPELNNIGVMLPYTGMHSMLFDFIKEPAFVMTSANPPNEPIIIGNENAITKLGSKVDYFLLHNKKIAQRCDDSVIRFHDNNPCLIRRSRGFSPEPIQVINGSDRNILAVGGELNVTACLFSENKAFISQHIGNVENLETLHFLKDSIDHLLKLTNCSIDVVACDLHPKFTTTKLAQEMKKKLDCQLVQVQHHHAHAVALMTEWNVEEIIAITCDGYGYGSDGTAWGGEVLYCNKERFQRVAHLEKHPMIGGDLATYYPLRMNAGILHEEVDVAKWLLKHSNKFPHGKKEVEIIMKQLDDDSVLKTTSCGRVLDAVSAMLGICYKRTYEGEPAIKLESMASKGRDILELNPKISGNILETKYMVNKIFDEKDRKSVPDLACSVQSYLAKGLAQLAIEEAERMQVKHIGFSGGVAYNQAMTKTIRKTVEKSGVTFLVHNKIPAGDGGTSFGQAIVAGFQK